MLAFFFFFNDTATTEIYTLSLHDALPISCFGSGVIACFSVASSCIRRLVNPSLSPRIFMKIPRSEEHTSELQSQSNLVCRLLLENKYDAERLADRAEFAGTSLADGAHTSE